MNLLAVGVSSIDSLESYGFKNMPVTHGIDFLFHPVDEMQYENLAPTLKNCIGSKRLQGYTQGWDLRASILIIVCLHEFYMQ